MSKEIYGTLIKHAFEVQAAQAAEDKVAIEAQGHFAPDVYFKNNPDGLWAAHELTRYIKKMGYDAEISIDPVDTKSHGLCLYLKVGVIPQTFLEDIKDYMSMREVQQGKAGFALWMDENGARKKTHETAMMAAFQNMKTTPRRGKSGLDNA